MFVSFACLAALSACSDFTPEPCLPVRTAVPAGRSSYWMEDGGGGFPFATQSPDEDSGVERLASDRGWPVVRAEDGRWVLYTSVGEQKAAETANLLRAVHERLDDWFGAPDPDLAGSPPVALLFLAKPLHQSWFCDALGLEVPDHADWLEQMKFTAPSILLFAPTVFESHLQGTSSSGLRPEMQVVHYSVHLELTRRYGAVPFWFAECLSYALQQELTGGVYAVHNRHDRTPLEDAYHRAWRDHAKSLLGGEGLRGADLFGDRSQPFEQDRAYLRFGFGSWLGERHPRWAPQLMDELLAGRGSDWPAAADYVPTDDEQSLTLERVLGDDWAAQVKDYWADQPAADGSSSIAGDIVEKVKSAAEEAGLKLYRSKEYPLVLYSDRRATEVKKILKMTEKVLARLDSVLGVAPTDEGPPLVACYPKEREAHAAICRAVAAADPGMAGAMEAAAAQESTYLPHAPVVSFLLDARQDAEVKPVNSIVHMVTHLELRRRFGPMPKQLVEGLATALEEEVLKEVWAPCFQSGFVSRLAHDWRADAGRLTRNRLKEKEDYAWSRVFQLDGPSSDQEAVVMNYALGVYGLEAEPEGLKRLLAIVQDEARGKYGAEITPQRMQELVESAYGEDFAADFDAFWKKRPKRPR